MSQFHGCLPFEGAGALPWVNPDPNPRHPSNHLRAELLRQRDQYLALADLAREARAANHTTLAALFHKARHAMAEKFADFMVRVPVELRQHQAQLLDFLAHESLLVPADTMFVGSALFEGWYVTSVLETLDVPFYTTDAEGFLTSYNQAAARLWGWTPHIGDQQWCGSWKIYTPNGDILPHHECPMAHCIRERSAVRGKWAIAERPDGGRIPFLPFASPLVDPADKFVGAINILLDITECMPIDN